MPMPGGGGDGTAIMTIQNEIRPALRRGADGFAATLTLALSADPVVRWAMPDANQHMSTLMPLVDAFGDDAAMERGTAYIIGDFKGAIIWLAPGVHPDDDALGEIFARNVDEPHLSEIYALFEAMADYHPSEPHWYLPLIGVDPASQRQGLGSALLDRAVAGCDRTRTLAYLEATSPASAAPYRRHGFDVIGEIAVASSPPMFPMVRTPR